MNTQICSTRTYALLILLCASIILSSLYLYPKVVEAQTTTAGFVATTTVNLSICGNVIVDNGEECDVIGETGGYSTTIVGRQCDVDCNYGPYCGDAILQTLFGEECDDGNNNDTDFCSALCKIEPAGSGGGGTSGGGSGGGGGSNEDLGDTQVSVTGRSIPSQTVHVLLDGKEVGTVRSDSEGRFDFATNASPGTVSLGFWTLDAARTKSITYTTTFDVTQGAITNVNGILVPPTISANNVNANPGETITFSGGTVPNTKVEVHIDGSSKVLTTTAAANGAWSLPFNTTGLSNAEHTARARFILGSGALTTQSSFSTTLQLFIGVAGAPSRPSDLNRDGGINLIDFSILIFWWGGNGGNSDPAADISGNGRVGLEDFSILLFNWTG
jgi:cysteine-rich repeat protein